MPSFAKIYGSIFTGSLRGKSDEILVFVNLLTHATCEGVADIHPTVIADETGLPLCNVTSALVTLGAPDPDSRSPKEEGKRIVSLDAHRSWGWRIVNHEFYRSLSSDNRYKEMTRERVRRYRQRKTNVTLQDPPVTLHALPFVSVSGSVQKGGTGGNETEAQVDFPPGFPATVIEAIRVSSTLGLPEQFVIDTWNKAAGRGGRDARDVPIRRWVNYLQTEYGYAKSRNGETAAANAKGNSVGNMPLGLQVQALQEAIDQHPANKQSVYFTAQSTDLDRAALKTMREKLRKLKEQVTQGIVNGH